MSKTRTLQKTPGLGVYPKLEKELEFYGCSMPADEFNDLLADLHHNMHRGWNSEQLLYRPSYGTVFVEAVRARSSQGLPEEMILRRLRNLSKKGE